jgi:glycosyltransferase involved in cell wall biosynthesis
MQPAISVVLPAYQRAGLVDRAIESVVQQRHTDWELIVVDDGSTDETATVLAQRTDPRIVPIHLDHNGGVSAARNAGLEAVRAPVVAFLDSDDVYLPNALEAYLQALAEHPDALAVEGLSIHANGRIDGHQLAGRNRSQVIAHEVAPHVQTLAVRVDRGAILRFDPLLRRGEDRQFGIELLDQGPIVGFGELVAKYLPQPDSLGRQQEVVSWERFFQLHAAEIMEDRELLGRWYRRLAARSSEVGDVRRTRRYLRLARRTLPRDPRPPLLLGLSYLSHDPIARARQVRRFVDPRRWRRPRPLVSPLVRTGGPLVPPT